MGPVSRGAPPTIQAVQYDGCSRGKKDRPLGLLQQCRPLERWCTWRYTLLLYTVLLQRCILTHEIKMCLQKHVTQICFQQSNLQTDSPECTFISVTEDFISGDVYCLLLINILLSKIFTFKKSTAFVHSTFGRYLNTTWHVPSSIQL